MLRKWGRCTKKKVCRTTVQGTAGVSGFRGNPGTECWEIWSTSELVNVMSRVGGSSPSLFVTGADRGAAFWLPKVVCGCWAGEMWLTLRALPSLLTQSVFTDLPAAHLSLSESLKAETMSNVCPSTKRSNPVLPRLSSPWGERRHWMDMAIWRHCRKRALR